MGTLGASTETKVAWDFTRYDAPEITLPFPAAAQTSVQTAADKGKQPRTAAEMPADKSIVANPTSPTISLVWFNSFWRNGSYRSKWLLANFYRSSQASCTIALPTAHIIRDQQSQLWIGKARSWLWLFVTLIGITGSKEFRCSANRVL